MIVYKTTNLINGMIYVGKYCGNRESYLGSGKYLKRAIKKYGKENFSRETLEAIDDNHDFLCAREKYWIAELDAMNPKIGYNLCEGGKGSSGYTHFVSEETRKKMSDNHADFSGENHPMWGKSPSDKTRQKMSDAQKGEKHSMFGTHPSEDTLEKLSKAKRGVRNHKALGREVILQVFTMLEEGSLPKDIVKKIKVSLSTVYRVKNGERDEMYNL